MAASPGRCRSLPVPDTRTCKDNRRSPESRRRTRRSDASALRRSMCRRPASRGRRARSTCGARRIGRRPTRRVVSRRRGSPRQTALRSRRASRPPTGDRHRLTRRHVRRSARVLGGCHRASGDCLRSPSTADRLDAMRRRAPPGPRHRLCKSDCARVRAAAVGRSCEPAGHRRLPRLDLVRATRKCRSWSVRSAPHQTRTSTGSGWLRKRLGLAVMA